MKISAAEYVIDLFGGLTATANILGKPVTTVQGWKDRGRIPTDHWPEIIKAADKRGKTLGVEDFIKTHRKRTAPKKEGEAA
ncbi:helix-turn-helix domain-containing protein [Pelagibacterium sp. 26DY04]|uniref:carph-isopro domain-containing protein n=1 Tax=Pelagibacterium sp. 26DY04 TaxID=2967130 RepID=UPI00281654DC|nr:hypothetical protein [Pelagibacterium sp. 26DY04]WMT88252.1 helix-turn-helix domain-containing protein [Pelagibacterium sp. 26DY04]